MPSLMVGNVATFWSSFSMILISVGDSDRSFGTNVAIEAGPTSSAVVEQAKKDGLPLQSFTVHDLRRTGSTLLNELGFNKRLDREVPNTRGRSFLARRLQ